MELFRQKATVDKDGRIDLKINTEFPEGEIDVVVILDSLISTPKTNISSFFGAITSFNVDPIENQKKIRNEWK